jgi:nicotinamidase-related amidase
MAPRSPLHAYVYGERRPLPDGFEGFVDPARSAVVSIDMHQGHLADTPDCPCPAPRAREIVAPIDRFHARARTFAVALIHVRSVLRRGGIDDVGGLPAAWRKVFPLHVGPIPNADEHAIEGTRWNDFETEVLPDDLIVQTKKRLTAFYPSDLDFLLRNMGTRTLVLDGVMADCCVLNTAFDASNLGYDVVVLRDLVRGTNAEMEAAAERIVSLHLGLVMDAADLVAAWQERAQQAAE